MTSIVRSVEAVDVGMTDSETTVTVLVTKGQNTAMCVPFCNVGVVLSTNSTVRPNMIDIEFTATAVVATREQTASIALTGICYVVEFEPDAGVVVQQGTFTIPDAGTNATDTIDAVTLAESFALVYHATPSRGSANQCLVDSTFNSATVLNFKRFGTLDALPGHWYVVSSDVLSTQDVVTTLTANITDTTVSAVVLADTFLWSDMGYNSANRFGDNLGTRVNMTNTTNLRRARNDSTASSRIVTRIVECDSSEFATQDFSIDANGVGTSTTTAITAIDQTRSMVINTNKTVNKQSNTVANADVGTVLAWPEFSADDEVTTTFGEAIAVQSLTRINVVEWELSDPDLFVGFNF